MKTHHLKLHWILPALLLSLASPSSAYEFEVFGRMEVTRGTNLLHSHPMQIFVRNNSWAILNKTQFPQSLMSATNQAIMAVETSYDGHFIYRLTHYEATGPVLQPDGLNQAPPGTGTGEIFQNEFPYAIRDPQTTIAFYAYASSGYLDAHTNEMIGPIGYEFYEGPQARSEPVRAYISRNWSQLRLPRQIAFLEPFQFVTNAMFTASSFTNIGNVTVPLNVSVTRGNTTFFFKAARVSPHCSKEAFAPAIHGSIFVTDKRQPGREVPIANADHWPTGPADQGYPR